MVYGESWENGTMKVPSWVPVTPPGAVAAASLDAAVPFNGKPSMSFAYTSGSGGAPAGLANRGMGGEGMYLQGGKPYEGMVFAMGSPGTLVTVALQDFTTGTTLASTTLPIPAGGASGFAQLNFTLTPSAGTTCAFITPGSDPTIECVGRQPRTAAAAGGARAHGCAHSSLTRPPARHQHTTTARQRLTSRPAITSPLPPLSPPHSCDKVPNADHACVRCGGQLLVGLSSPGAAAHLSYVYLQPGPWGRVGGMPVNAAAGQLVKDFGINVIRQGGTVSRTLRWKARVVPLGRRLVAAAVVRQWWCGAPPPHTHTHGLLQ
jgi:hypothetical protein